MKRDVVVIHEHPEWQQPLFAALERRSVSFGVIDLKSAAFADDDPFDAQLYFNQASPSAYLRGNTRAVPAGLALLRTLEQRGALVLNGAAAFALELSKSAQAALLHRLDVDHPRSVTFNDVDALRRRALPFGWPAMLKPDQGGSGARMQLVASMADVEAYFANDPAVWLPDNLFLLQEYLDSDPAQGIVRLEMLGSELLYAMRVVTHGRYNLCPAPVCNPDDGGGAGACHVDVVSHKPVEFHPYPDVPRDAVDAARHIMRAANIDIGGIEYLTTRDGRRVFYDINANSNLRWSIGAAFGFDPFERVVDYLLSRLVSPRFGA